MSEASPFHLFEVFGVELEYMIVDAGRLSVLPAADQVLYQAAGQYVSELELDGVSWSNELALHVIELKTTAPAAALEPLSQAFQQHVVRINQWLQPLGGRLMPSAMHPWMDPAREMKLWPHGYSRIYEAFDRIFDCRGHGWANLQSVHLNLPFAGDDEFARLHAAIRLLLPIMPALAASSPLMEGRLSGLVDSRLDVYRANARRVPSVSGRVVPEPVFSREEYQRLILQKIYRDIAPYDPEGILQHEWLNARGAIARFDRNTIEIRVLDMQECPHADLAICAAISRVLRAMASERWTGLTEQQSFGTELLEALLLAVIRDGEKAIVNDRAFLAQFGFPSAVCEAHELWRHLIAATDQWSGGSGAAWREALHVILQQGPLSRRIINSAAGSPLRIRPIYEELCNCLAAGRMFLGV